MGTTGTTLTQLGTTGTILTQLGTTGTILTQLGTTGTTLTQLGTTGTTLTQLGTTGTTLAQLGTTLTTLTQFGTTGTTLAQLGTTATILTPPGTSKQSFFLKQDHLLYLGPVYIKHQHQCCNNSAMMLAILFALKVMESLENGLQPHSRAAPLFQSEQNHRCHYRVVVALMLMLGVNGPLPYVFASCLLFDLITIRMKSIHLGSTPSTTPLPSTEISSIVTTSQSSTGWL